MARTAIAAAQIITLNNPEQVVAITADARDLAFVDSDDINGMEFVPSGRDMLLAFNDEVGAQTITIDAAADDAGRDGSIAAYSIGAGETAWFGMFNTEVWRQSDGKVHVDMSDAGIQIILFRLP
jgi:hypothetical protein